MRGLLSSGVLGVILAAFAMAMVYVALWSGLDLFQRQDVRPHRRNPTNGARRQNG